MRVLGGVTAAVPGTSLAVRESVLLTDRHAAGQCAKCGAPGPWAGKGGHWASTCPCVFRSDALAARVAALEPALQAAEERSAQLESEAAALAKENAALAKKNAALETAVKLDVRGLQEQLAAAAGTLGDLFGTEPDAWDARCAECPGISHQRTERRFAVQLGWPTRDARTHFGYRVRTEPGDRCAKAHAVVPGTRSVPCKKATCAFAAAQAALTTWRAAKTGAAQKAWRKRYGVGEVALVKPPPPSKKRKLTDRAPGLA